jgi:hypothetical protein
MLTSTRSFQLACALGGPAGHIDGVGLARSGGTFGFLHGRPALAVAAGSFLWVALLSAVAIGASAQHRLDLAAVWPSAAALIISAISASSVRRKPH